jgi:hypothetical protein
MCQLNPESFGSVRRYLANIDLLVGRVKQNEVLISLSNNIPAGVAPTDIVDEHHIGD